MSRRAPQPPSAWKKSLSVVCGFAGCSSSAGGVVAAASTSGFRMSTSFSSRSSSTWSRRDVGSAMRCLRAELVARVEHHPVAVDNTDPPGGDQLGAGVDPGDLAPAEPDQLDRAGAVVQLTLQGWYAAA